MISSLMTFRLNLRSADSIDSLLFTEIYAISLLTSFRLKFRPTGQTTIRHDFLKFRKPPPLGMFFQGQREQMPTIYKIGFSGGFINPKTHAVESDLWDAQERLETK